MKRIVVALGGNALLKRGETPSADVQRGNIAVAARALAPLAGACELVITHGNGPQVGLLALQSATSDPAAHDPLDVLDAETQGQIGYVIEQELMNALPERKACAALLTQIEVDPADPAFLKPTKPIGPLYGKAEADELAREKRWNMARDGGRFRRVVASPRPQRILELEVIRLLVAHGVVVICAGGGGIPVVRRADDSLCGAEAVIDKDHASALLARELEADALLLLTDVDAVYTDWGSDAAKAIRSVTPEALSRMTFEPGSMAPKVAAAREFVACGGALAAIGCLADAAAILEGRAGTRITGSATATE